METPKRRGKLDYIPALAGLPDDQQKQLYKQARREVGWSWQAFAMVGLWLSAGLAIFELIPVVHGSQWNPGVPRSLVGGLLLAALVYALAPLSRWYDLHVIAPRIWRRLPHICNGCGYDLTGNTSGRCPECGVPTPGPGGPRKAI